MGISPLLPGKSKNPWKLPPTADESKEDHPIKGGRRLVVNLILIISIAVIIGLLGLETLKSLFRF